MIGLVMRSRVRNLFVKRFAIFLDLKVGPYYSSANHVESPEVILAPRNRGRASVNGQVFVPFSQVITRRILISPIRTRTRASRIFVDRSAIPIEGVHKLRIRFQGPNILVKREMRPYLVRLPDSLFQRYRRLRVCRWASCSYEVTFPKYFDRLSTRSDCGFGAKLAWHNRSLCMKVIA
jgi:hypothetical protein